MAVCWPVQSINVRTKKACAAICATCWLMVTLETLPIYQMASVVHWPEPNCIILTQAPALQHLNITFVIYYDSFQNEVRISGGKNLINRL